MAFYYILKSSIQYLNQVWRDQIPRQIKQSVNSSHISRFSNL